MPAWRRPERNIMRKLSKNTALGYLTLLAVALLTAGRALIFLLPQTDFWQLINTLSQLTITLSGGIWLFSRIYEELLNKKRADIFRTISVLTGILGFIFCLSGLAADWRALNPWGLAARISFAVFALSWALYTAAQAFGLKARPSSYAPERPYLSARSFNAELSAGGGYFLCLRPAPV